MQVSSHTQLTAQRVEEALRHAGHETQRIEPDADLVRRLDELGPDLAFLALHGRDGEDGALQELLDVLGVPYTGSGAAASERCFDKVLTKRELDRLGIPTLPAVTVADGALRRLGVGDALDRVGARLGFPLVVKPATQGSGLGLGLVDGPDALPSAIVAALSYGDRALLERLVDGEDLAVSVLAGPDGRPEALPPVAIRRKDQDGYAARYTIGHTEFECPADLAPETDAEARRIAVDAFGALGLAGYGRVDLLRDRATGALWVLEVETLPGLTHTSYLPVAAEAAGLSFDALVARIVDAAVPAGR